MTTPAAHADPSGGFMKNEPVVAAHIAAWVVLNAGILLVSRYHVFTAAQWSVAAIELSSLVTAAVLFVMGWLIRRVVSPAWKLAGAEAAKVGITLPAYYSGAFIGPAGVGTTTYTSPMASAPAETATEPAPLADPIYPAGPIDPAPSPTDTTLAAPAGEAPVQPDPLAGSADPAAMHDPTAIPDPTPEATA